MTAVDPVENTVPDVGSVRLVVPVVAKVNEFAPDVIRLAPAAMFNVLVPLLVMVKPLNEVPVTAPTDSMKAEPAHVERAVFSTLLMLKRVRAWLTDNAMGVADDPVLLPMIEFA